MLQHHVRKVGYWLVPTITLLPKHDRWRKQAEAQKLSRGARARLEWFIYYEAKSGGNALRTARHFGIAPKTFHAWKKRFDDRNLRTLEEKSRAPKRVRQRAITTEEEMRVVALRKQYLRWGKKKIAVLYKRIHGAPISSWKVQYTIAKYRLYYHPQKNAQTQAKRARAKAKKRITMLAKKPFPGFLIALDTIVLYWLGTKRYVFTAIDTASKIAFARMYTTKSSKNAGDFIDRMAYLLDYELWNTCHDNGSEFKKDFQKAIAVLKLDDWWSRERTPKDNPVNERFNRTVEDEFIAMGNMVVDTSEFNRRLTEWLVTYNFVRPHQSLGYATPWEYYEKTAKVLPMYSSRTGY